MKIICHPDHLHEVKSMLRDYLHLDIVIVEKGFEYEGLCYYFSMDHLDNLLDYLKQDESYLLCYQENKMYYILPKQVILIEGFSKEAYLYTKNNQYETDKKLYELEEILKPYHFARINKSMIVNINEIDHMVPDVQRRYIIILKNKMRVILTRNYVKPFMNQVKRRTL